MKKKVKINQSNSLAVYKGCIIVKGWSWAEIKAQKIKMSNTVPSISKHLSECKNFRITYLNKIDYVKENIEMRKQRAAELHIVNNLKKQTLLDQSKIIFYKYFCIIF